MPNKPRRVIFSADEVRAYMAGRKTQFRRVIDPQPQKDGGKGLVPVFPYNTPEGRWTWVLDTGMGVSDTFASHFGRPGDPLYVAETWRIGGSHHDSSVGAIEELYATSDIQENHLHYLADEPERATDTPWRPSTQMPRWASRLGPVVTDVRVQRVQEVSTDDALAEGVDLSADLFPGINAPDKALRLFPSLWNSRNANPEHTWAANPWVWAVTVTSYEPKKG